MLVTNESAKHFAIFAGVEDNLSIEEESSSIKLLNFSQSCRNKCVCKERSTYVTNNFDNLKKFHHAYYISKCFACVISVT